LWLKRQSKRKLLTKSKAAKTDTERKIYNPSLSHKSGTDMQIYIKQIGGTWFGLALQGQNVVATTFASNPDKVLEKLQDITCTKTAPEKSMPAFVEKLFTSLRMAYEGKAVASEVALAMQRLPSYTQCVLNAVCQIPRGYVASYGGVATAVGGGARAVGNVMANNPFAPVVPCHRVVTSNLGLGGYGGGLQVKYEFLKREQQGFAEPKEILIDGQELRVFPVEFVLQKLKKATTSKK
jgi:O-6-methylguanine DNA methyltransferase